MELVAYFIYVRMVLIELKITTRKSPNIHEPVTETYDPVKESNSLYELMIMRSHVTDQSIKPLVNVFSINL